MSKTAQKNGKHKFDLTTQADIARALGVTRQTVSTWAQSPDFPQNIDGTFPLPKVIEWRVRREVESAGNSDLREKLLQAQIAKLVEDARAKRLRNDVLEERLVPFDEVFHYLAETASFTRSRFQAFPDEAIVSVPSQQQPTVRQALQHAVHHFLLELSGRKFEPSKEVD